MCIPVEPTGPTAGRGQKHRGRRLDTSRPAVTRVRRLSSGPREAEHPCIPREPLSQWRSSTVAVIRTRPGGTRTQAWPPVRPVPTQQHHPGSRGNASRPPILVACRALHGCAQGPVPSSPRSQPRWQWTPHCTPPEAALAGSRGHRTRHSPPETAERAHAKPPQGSPAVPWLIGLRTGAVEESAGTQ